MQPIKRYESLMSSLAASLILIAPFVSFLKHYNYSYLAPENLIVFAALIGVGCLLGLLMWAGGRVGTALIGALLLTLFFDIGLDWLNWWGKRVLVTFGAAFLVVWLLNRNATRVIAIAFGAIIASTLLLPADGTPLATASAVEADAANARQSAASEDLPIIIHLIADEHIGIEGIPTDIDGGRALREELKRFYIERGFRLFGGAYSEFYSTLLSLSHTFNNEAVYNERLVHEIDTGRYNITKNEYFRRMEKSGFKLFVYQSSYLDFCKDPQITYAKCVTYAFDSIEPIEDSDMPVLDKLRILLSMRLANSFFYDRLRSFYAEIRFASAEAKMHLPPWNWERDRVGSIAVTTVYEQLLRGLGSAEPGDLIVAHLLLPHYPYALGEDCRPRHAGDWLNRNLPATMRNGRSINNTPESRTARYDAYFAQLHCFNRMVNSLIETLKEAGKLSDSVILVHGDHGSRINIHDPVLKGNQEFSRQDFNDTFSTLFAVRAEAIEPGYDPRPSSIRALFQDLMAHNFQVAPEPSAKPPSVFVQNPDYVRWPFHQPR